MASTVDGCNVAPTRGAAKFWTFLALVSIAGFALLVHEIRTISVPDLGYMGPVFIVVAALIVVGELRPLVTAGAPDASGVNMATAFVFALLLHWGLAVALMMQAIATFMADMLERKIWWRATFNVAQYVLSYAAAAGVLHLLGHSPTPRHGLSFGGGDLPAFVVAAAVFFLVNNGLVAQAVALRDNESFETTFRVDLGYSLASTWALLGLAPIVVDVIDRGPALVPLLLLPLGAVYGTAAMSREREQQSLHDSLTGLANRKLLVEQARAAIRLAAAQRHYVALFLIDLDRFKEINDTLGHQVGDRLLEMVARRLQDVLRPEDIVGRLGGDEFALLVSDLEQPRTALDVAERIRAALAEPFRHEGMSFEIEGSIGIAVFPDHGSDFESLLQRADVAMYVAKERSTGVQIYSVDIDRHSTVRLGMLSELRAALAEDQLELHFQPKADLRTGDVIGVECLLRWEHPERGVIPPDEFLPLAEQTGLMRLITGFAVDAALGQLSVWWRQGLRIQAAVNVCARDLYDRGFAERLAERIARFEVPPRALMIEVTESVLMADPARAASTLLSLAGMGIGVSLDDFGTGYSSLVHLKRLPVSEVKIDKSFVLRMDVNDDDAAIVRSIIDLAGALGLRVVAEGVETREAWDRLAVYGCDAAQGYYLSRALPAERMTEWLLANGDGTTRLHPVASVNATDDLQQSLPA
jgi:diguanylate cyclase (GGDEF)-like protein